MGKTSLIYHLAWMLSETGHRVLACDLDPQASLSAAFLDEHRLEVIWNNGKARNKESSANTIAQCVEPLMQVGDLHSPALEKITPDLHLIAGDLALSGFEDTLSAEWPNALGSTNLYRPLQDTDRFFDDHAGRCQANGRIRNSRRCWSNFWRNQPLRPHCHRLRYSSLSVPSLFSLQGLRNAGTHSTELAGGMGKADQQLATATISPSQSASMTAYRLCGSAAQRPLGPARTGL